VNAGLIDEFTGDRALTVLFRLRNPPCFEAWTRAAWPWSRVRAEPTQRVTHLTYAVRERNPDV